MIKKIVLKIGKKEISLTTKEAKELKGVLGDLFGDDIHHYHHDHYPTWPYRHWHWTDTVMTATDGITGSINCVGSSAVSNATTETLYLSNTAQ